MLLVWRRRGEGEMKFDLGGKAVTGWRDLLMRLYAEDVFGMRVVSDKIRPRMIAHVRSLLQDTNRVATVPDAALGAIVKQYTEVATVDERLSFLEKLATDLGTSKSDAVTAFERFMQQDSPDAMRQLRIEVTPAYNRLLHRLVNVKGGLHLVVEMRADLLSSPNKVIPKFQSTGQKFTTGTKNKNKKRKAKTPPPPPWRRSQRRNAMSVCVCTCAVCLFVIFIVFVLAGERKRNLAFRV